MSNTDDAGDLTGTYDPTESGSMPHSDALTGSDAASDLVHIVPEAGKVSQTARALLEAAGEDREHEVRSADGGFDVPADIADAVNLSSIEADEAVDETGDEQPQAARKAAAKRAPRKAAGRKR